MEIIEMKTTHATEAAESATNINREDWISGATELVMIGSYQYDRSTWKSKEAFISLDNIMDDVMASDLAKREVTAWIQGDECCDCREEMLNIVYSIVRGLLSQMADDFNIGVRL